MNQNMDERLSLDTAAYQIAVALSAALETLERPKLSARQRRQALAILREAQSNAEELTDRLDFTDPASEIPPPPFLRGSAPTARYADFGENVIPFPSRR